jgi:8-oxo-dGTP diphosphatase
MNPQSGLLGRTRRALREIRRRGADSSMARRSVPTAASVERPRFGSALLVRHGDDLLLAQRAKEPHRGMWVLPGGGIHAFETIAEAARREIREETGLQVELGAPVGVLEIVRPPNEHRVIFYNWAIPVGGDLRPASDVSALRWVTREQLQSLDLTEAVRDVLIEVGWLPGQPRVPLAMALPHDAARSTARRAIPV